MYFYISLKKWIIQDDAGPKYQKNQKTDVEQDEVNRENPLFEEILKNVKLAEVV